jgi:hypothetical protein
MTQIGAEVGAYKFIQTFSTSSPLVPILVEARVVENTEARLIPFMSEITEFESDLTLLQDSIDNVEVIVTDNNTLLENPVFGLEAIKDNHAAIIAEIDANEVLINAVKAKTDLLPADPASEANVDSVEVAVLTRPDINEIQARLDLLEAAIRGLDTRDLTEVYDVFDLTPVAKTTDPRFDNLDATISSRSTLTAADVWSHVTRTLTDLTIPAAEIDKVWAYLVSQATTPSSMGKLIVDFLDAAVSTRATPADITGPLVGVAQESTLTAFAGTTGTNFTQVDSDNAAIKADTTTIKGKTNSLPSDPASQAANNSRFTSIDSDLANQQLDITAVKAKTDNLPVDPAKESSVAAIPTNPFLSTDPRANNMDASVSTRATPADVANEVVDLVTSLEYQNGKGQIISEINENEGKIDTANINILAVKSKTDNLPVDPSKESTLVAGVNTILAAIDDLPPPGGSLTAADVWAFTTRTLTDPNSYKADVSGLATSAEIANIPPSYMINSSTTLDSLSDDQEVIAWLEKDGKIIAGSTDCAVAVKNAAGTIVWSDTLASSNADGVFKFTQASVVLSNNKNYYIAITIKDGTETVVANTPFFTVT